MSGSVNNAYDVNDYVVYFSNGVCHIDDIRNECFAGLGERRYYVMHAISDPKSVIYVPVDSEKLVSGMQRILSKEELLGIVDASEEDDIAWISDTKLRAAAFSEIVDSGDRKQMLRIVKALSIHKKRLEADRKRMYASDERILNAALKTINEEFSFVLGIDQKDVIPYILERIGHTE